MATQPTFTVIIPTYDRPALLAEAIASVIAQTDPDWELIVVDDASPRPVEVPTDPRITLLRNPTNIGKSASLNRAVSLAKGRMVSFLDDDDLWGPDRLRHARRGHEQAEVVVCLTRTLGEEPLLPLRRWRDWVMSNATSAWGLPLGHMGADSILRDLCPTFDESFAACEDWDWGIRVMAAGPSVRIIRHADFVWRRHDGVRHNNGSRTRIRGSYELLTKHAAFFDAHRALKAQRLYRLALMHERDGDVERARYLLLDSLRCFPGPRALRRWVRLSRRMGDS